MNREELEAYILNHYSTEPDYPWADTPRAAVFRHANNRKWFALVMDVPRDKLGLQERKSSISSISSAIRF